MCNFRIITAAVQTLTCASQGQRASGKEGFLANSGLSISYAQHRLVHLQNMLDCCTDYAESGAQKL